MMMFDLMMFDAHDWFWIVGSNQSSAWSSAAGDYVETWDETRTTRIASEAELSDVLHRYGMCGPLISDADYKAAVSAHIDAVASERDFDGAIDGASYAASTNPAWAAEAAALIAWRDAVWVHVDAELVKFRSGARAEPTPADMVAELTVISWPA